MILNSFKKFITGGILAGTVAVFVIVYIFSFLLFSRLMESRAIETSKAISAQTFNSMYEVMRKGWVRSDVEDFLEATRHAYRNTAMKVEVYRGPAVEELYGKIRQPEFDDEVKSVFLTGQEILFNDGSLIRYTLPLAARAECLRCHTNASEGAVLGIIRVDQDLSSLFSEARTSYLLFFLGMFPVPIIGGLLLAMLLGRKIDKSILRINRKVESINSVKDIKNLDFQEIDLHFTELNSLLHNVAELANRMKHIAIDKDILEFEIRLMEKFIISSEVIKDWAEYVSQLMRDMNEVIDVDCLYTIFKSGDADFELDIFWKTPVGIRTREVSGGRLRSEISGHPSYGEGSVFSVTHHTVSRPEHDTGTPPETDRNTIIERSRTLILDSPKIGGVVGLGLQSVLSEDPHRRIIIESILTTLLNAVGSVRAVNKYTRDLEYYATRDPLTNLYNQRVFWDLLDYEIGRADRHNYKFSLLLIDLDNFKTINDRYGHAFGDIFLKEFARVMRDSTRKEDICARYGGDEFTIILPESDGNQSFAVAQNIKNAVDAITIPAPDGTPVRGTVSIGITVYPDHGTTARDLFLISDNMMYRAKKEGKNNLQLPSVDDVAEVYRGIGQKSIMILNSIDQKKIIPFYQPIRDLRTGQIAVHELLMRIDLNGQLVAASEFIEVAENMGVVHKLDYILLERALDDLKRTGYTGKLFINLSPRALLVPEFITNMRKLASDFGIDPSVLVFEITERETVRNLSLLEKFVRDLKGEGFQFAVDDFGSGFSSFGYIKRFPIDYIKIDGEFIRNMVCDNRDRAMVKSITTLADELGIATIAEFVEDQEILSVVSDSGIRYAQGYYVGRPASRLILP